MDGLKEGDKHADGVHERMIHNGERGSSATPPSRKTRCTHKTDSRGPVPDMVECFRAKSEE
jgi:hypothetical protein